MAGEEAPPSWNGRSKRLLYLSSSRRDLLLAMLRMKVFGCPSFYHIKPIRIVYSYKDLE